LHAQVTSDSNIVLLKGSIAGNSRESWQNQLRGCNMYHKVGVNFEDQPFDLISWLSFNLTSKTTKARGQKASCVVEDVHDVPVNG